MLSNPAKPAADRSAPAYLRYDAEPFFLTLTDGSADIDGMGVNNEKGSIPSVSSS
ncbi:MAG: hypothetical protein ABIH86_03500 [Planctomycetota bacterium]